MTALDSKLVARVADAIESYLEGEPECTLHYPAGPVPERFVDGVVHLDRIAQAAIDACCVGELVELLRDTVEVYGTPGGPWNVPGEPGSWICHARALLAKMEGKP